jgi:phytoene dehydrogenase-like protein
MKENAPVVIVGAGVAGLCCAADLLREGVSVQVLEASDATGGRVRTDECRGFRLDRGFQVWLEAYPECRKRLPTARLQPGAFHSGAILYDGQQCRRFPDPFRHPSLCLEGAFHPVGSLKDKLLLQKLRREQVKTPAEQAFSGSEMTTLAYWRETGFSEKMIQGFLRPFFRGIFLGEPDDVSRRMFDFVFGMFGKGRALLPKFGMEEIPRFLTSELGQGVVRCHTRVDRVQADRVMTSEGEEVPASAVVVAVEDPVSLGLQLEAAPRETRPVTCLYFDASKPPVEGPWLVLNGSGTGQVNQVSVNSSVAEGLAPEGRHLISVSLQDMPEMETTPLVRRVTDELQHWFGTQVEGWKFLRDYRIDHALPAFAPGQLPGPGVAEEEGVVVCGDGLRHPSLQGAMESGAMAAARVLERMRP